MHVKNCVSYAHQNSFWHMYSMRLRMHTIDTHSHVIGSVHLCFHIHKAVLYACYFHKVLCICCRILCIDHTLNPRWVILCDSVYSFSIKIVLTSLPLHIKCFCFWFIFSFFSCLLQRFVKGNTQRLAAEYTTDLVLLSSKTNNSLRMNVG